MFSEGKAIMKLFISLMSRSFKTWLKRYPKVRRWMWFMMLWWGGLGAVLVATYPFKALMRLASSGLKG